MGAVDKDCQGLIDLLEKDREFQQTKERLGYHEVHARTQAHLEQTKMLAALQEQNKLLLAALANNNKS